VRRKRLPSIVMKLLGGGRRVVPVALHDLRAVHHDLADFAGPSIRVA
jgi:hypothetical protein